jgi:hypothetical protein
MNAPIVIAPVRKSVRVKAPVARAFDVFTSGLSRWWPLDHGVPRRFQSVFAFRRPFAVASRCNFNCG